MADYAKQAARILLETKSVLCNIEQPFTYTSGKQGPVYVDCRRPLSFPQARKELMDMAAAMLRDNIGADKIDLIAGAETAGIPYGALIADRLAKPMIYVRKKPKGHGRMSQIEGHIDDRTQPYVVLTEDLQNYGSSKKVFIEALRESGATVEHFFVLFDYGVRPEVAKDNDSMGLTQHNLCNWWDILAVAKEHNIFDTKTLSSVEAFLNDPADWQSRNTAQA